MAYSIIIHLAGEDPIVGEVDELPSGSDTSIIVHHPRRRDGKDIQYLSNDVVAAIWPINQISFIEVMPGESEERIMGFVRE